MFSRMWRFVLYGHRTTNLSTDAMFLVEEALFRMNRDNGHASRFTKSPNTCFPESHLEAVREGRLYAVKKALLKANMNGPLASDPRSPELTKWLNAQPNKGKWSLLTLLP